MFRTDSFSTDRLFKNVEMTMTRNSVEFDSNQLSDSNTARLYSKKTEQKKNEHVKSQNNEKSDYNYKKYRKKIDAFQKKKRSKN